MKNILFILPWLPYPLKSGGHQAIFNGIRAVVDDYNVFITYDRNEDDDTSEEQANLLKAFGHTVTILPYTNKIKKEKQSILLRCYIRFQNIKERINNFFCPQQKKIAPYFFKIAINDNRKILFINDIIKSYNIDIVQCEMISHISDVLYLPSNVKKIYVQHQIDYIRNQLDLQQQNLISKYEEELYQSKQSEIFLLNQFDFIIALSEHDKNIMQKDGVSTPIHVSPAIVSTEPHPFNNSTKKKILSFVGPSRHPPNVAGLQWFLENCWNDLKKKDGEFTLQIIGEWDHSLKETFSKKFPEIKFRGFIPDLEEFIKNTIMIVPINIGSGIRMKILEAISLGIPVVSTVIGAQGLPLEDQIDCYITDDSHTFVLDILKLKDVDTQQRMVKNAQKKIIKNYSFPNMKASRLELYNTLV